jgi:hypothetical protein
MAQPVKVLRERLDEGSTAVAEEVHDKGATAAK